MRPDLPFVDCQSMLLPVARPSYSGTTSHGFWLARPARGCATGEPGAGTVDRVGVAPRDLPRDLAYGACLGVGGVLALEARARAGAAHDGRAEFTVTAVSWGIHLFQVPFHPVGVERRLARVEVSRLPARHVGGPRVEV